MVQLKHSEENARSFFNRFQFHNGTIKTVPINSNIACVSDFNSIMVQLKHFDIHREDNGRGFQFHNGTIKTHRHL